MDINYIALAIPIFLLLIGVELAFAWHEKKDFYRFNDAVNDMSCGIADQVVGIFSKVLIFAGYLWIYENFRLLEISSTSVFKLASNSRLFPKEILLRLQIWKNQNFRLQM